MTDRPADDPAERSLRLPGVLPFVVPLHLPPGAYLDHLAFICDGRPAHARCAPGSRWSYWRITGQQVRHAVGLTWTGRVWAAFYAVSALGSPFWHWLR